MPRKSSGTKKALPGFRGKGYFRESVGWTAIHQLRDAGETIASIAEKCGCDRSTVRYQLARPPPEVRVRKSSVPAPKQKQQKKRLQSVKTLAGRKKKSGLPKFNSARGIVFALRKRHMFSSKSTVLRDLHTLGAVFRTRPVCPAGADSVDVWKKKRMDAACSWGASGVKDKEIWFSDEKIFAANDGERFCWLLPGEMPPVYRQKRWNAKLHVVGVIGRDYRYLARLDGYVTAETYQRAIITPARSVPARALFMQDGAAVHTAKATLKMFEEVGVNLLAPWPPCSPDLNPIENMWAIVSREVEKRMPLNEGDDLWRIVKQCWDRIPVSTVNRLVASFPGRVKKLVTQKGETVQNLLAIRIDPLH